MAKEGPGSMMVQVRIARSSFDSDTRRTPPSFHVQARGLTLASVDPREIEG